MKVRWDMRVEEEDLAAWKLKAVESGVLLSEWIRSVLNGHETSNSSGGVARRKTPEVHSERAGDADSARAVDRPEGDTEKRSHSSCVHGIVRGYRCWQCGGIAKAGKE